MTTSRLSEKAFPRRGLLVLNESVIAGPLRFLPTAQQEKNPPMSVLARFRVPDTNNGEPRRKRRKHVPARCEMSWEETSNVFCES